MPNLLLNMGIFDFRDVIPVVYPDNLLDVGTIDMTLIFRFIILLMLSNIALANEVRPVLTTAGVVHVCPQNKIALIKRGKKPFGLAMFGGHVEHESPAAAFVREAQEELSITDISKMYLMGVHGQPGRDPRQHSVEITYACVTYQTPLAASDAKEVLLFSFDELKALVGSNEAFAFDHKDILSEYLNNLDGCNPCINDCPVGIEVKS